MTYDQFIEQVMEVKQTNMVIDKLYYKALYAQFMHETGNAQSNLFKNHKNFFGMRPSRQRPVFYSGEIDTKEGSYATYNNMHSSIADRMNLDEYNNTNEPDSMASLSHYMNEVKRKGYATDPDYVKLWAQTFNRLFPNGGTVDEAVVNGSDGGNPLNGGYNADGEVSQDGQYDADGNYVGTGTSKFGFLGKSLKWIFLVAAVLVLGYLAKKKLKK